MYSTYLHTNKFELESGESLSELEIAYHTYGKLNKAKDNVIWVCHALTANSDVYDWWNGLFGDQAFFNNHDYYIVCANIIGSNYGSTSPLSINPKTQKPYYKTFPQLTNKDVANAFDLLRKYLNINNIQILIGSSLGGMHALELSIKLNCISNLIVIATNCKHSAWGIAFNESQRLAIEADATWNEANSPNSGEQGLIAARSIALLSYRNYDTYKKTQTDTENLKIDSFKASSYQRYQGEKLNNRFNAYSYYLLTKMMDSNNIGRNRESIISALKSIGAKTLVIGVNSDIIFPVEEQKFIAKHIKNAQYKEINSLYGHDGFLIETDQLESIIKDFIN